MSARTPIALALVVAALAFGACAAPAARPSEPAPQTPQAQVEPTPSRPEENATVETPPMPLAGTKWTLTQIDGAAAASDGAPATLEFEADRLAGSTGCNRFFGGFTATANTLSVGQMGSTRMACPEPLMTQESNVLAILGAADGYTIVDATLTITATDGRTLVYTQA